MSKLIHDMELEDAGKKGEKDAKHAVDKYAKSFGSKLKQERENRQKLAVERSRRMNSQQDLKTLATAIREFVWAESRLAIATLRGDQAEITKQQEQSTRMETSMREHLDILNSRVMDGQSGGRPHYRLK